jgi:hypothetical protein
MIPTIATALCPPPCIIISTFIHTLTVLGLGTLFSISNEETLTTGSSLARGHCCHLHHHQQGTPSTHKTRFLCQLEFIIYDRWIVPIPSKLSQIIYYGFIVLPS